MKLILRIIFALLSNLTALLAAAYFIKEFEITGGFKEILIIAAVFTLINLFIKPILKLIFSPIIFITFGLGIIFVNAAVLYLLDFFPITLVLREYCRCFTPLLLSESLI